MSDLVDRDLACIVVDLVDDTIVALANSIATIVTGKLLGPPRPRIAGQGLNLADDTTAISL